MEGQGVRERRRLVMCVRACVCVCVVGCMCVYVLACVHACLTHKRIQSMCVYINVHTKRRSSISDKGILMTFGSGINGCLGHGDNKDVTEVSPPVHCDAPSAGRII